MYGLEMGQKVWAAIIQCVHELFEEYRMQLSSPAAATTSTNQAITEGGGSMMKQLIANRLRQGNSSNGGSKSELDKYLAEDCEDPETKLDILAWWAVNSSRFPTLAKMARDILAIPISTVASESAFSTSGRILDDFRTSLTPFMVQALVCTQDWLRRSTDLVDIQENLEALEELEKGKFLYNQPCYLHNFGAITISYAMSMLFTYFATAIFHIILRTICYMSMLFT